MPDTPELAAHPPMVQLLSALLWPSFVMAAVATGVFFTWFDPLDLLSCTGEPPFSRSGAYTLGFFAFWLLGAGCSALTVFFLLPGARFNRARPHGR